MNERKILVAEEGTVLTDGTVYGRQILLGDGIEERRFYVITEEEYEARINIPVEPARESDYQEALREMGVTV